MKTVIIGGVAAGMSAATRLRRLDESREITIFERSGYVSFANCGLPYHLGGVIADRQDLLLQTPQSLKSRFNLDVHVNHEVTSINREAKTVTVKGPGGSFTQSYDELILTPGATPFTPDLPGIEKAYGLRNIEDLDALMERSNGLLAGSPIVVMGAGFIGLEVAENLTHRGFKVMVVELSPQVLTPFDEELAAVVHKRLTDNGVNCITGQAVSAIGDDHVILTDNSSVPAALVIAAVGVKPDSTLAKTAGLQLDKHGAIIVDETGRTSDENIFAAGDCALKSSHFGGSTMVPLANRANIHGRLIADTIAGRKVHQPATLGTAIIGLFGLSAAVTGMNERQAKASGYQVTVIHTHPFDHATYYPEAKSMSLKVILETETWRILGAQAVGEKGVDKRIDVIATAIKANMTGPELAYLELSYAPPFGAAKDPVNMVGLIAENIANGLVETIQWHEAKELADRGAKIIDVRSFNEFSRGSIPGAINIPLDQIRKRLTEFQNGDIIYCQVGLRGYFATRILNLNNIRTFNLDGGYRTWERK